MLNLLSCFSLRFHHCTHFPEGGNTPPLGHVYIGFYSVFEDIHLPKTNYCASRCRFTIAISSLPVLRMHALLCEFCFSLGFYHCHFTVAICLCAVSYALTTIHSHTILLPAAVLPFQFEQCLLKRYAFDVLQIRSHMHLLSLPTKYCASR